MSRRCYCDDCNAVRDTPISVGKGTVPYSYFLVRGTHTRIGDSSHVYDNELHLPNDLEGWWIDKGRRMIGARRFLESYLTGHTVEKIYHGLFGRPRD